ncbi:MAG: peptidoglycan-binding protein [Elusimicrobia bacterium]|nr:peptidoglycan-binding protein [Elusimicrobiota bacterium]
MHRIDSALAAAVAIGLLTPLGAHANAPAPAQDRRPTPVAQRDPAPPQQDEDPTRELREGVTRKLDIAHELVTRVQDNAAYMDLTRRFEEIRTGAERAAHAKNKEGLEQAGAQIGELRKELAEKHNINATEEEENQIVAAFHQRMTQRHVAPVLTGAGVNVRTDTRQIPGVPVVVEPTATPTSRVVARHTPGQRFQYDREVHTDQRRLVTMGFGPNRRQMNDGKYGPVTSEAVRRFQEHYARSRPDMTNPLVADGVMTEATRDALRSEHERVAAERAQPRGPRQPPATRQPPGRRQPPARVPQRPPAGQEEEPRPTVPVAPVRPPRPPAPVVPGVTPLTGATPTHFRANGLPRIDPEVRNEAWRDQPSPLRNLGVGLHEGLDNLVHGFGIFASPAERQRVAMPISGEGNIDYEATYGYRVLLAKSERHGHGGRWADRDVVQKLIATANRMKQAGSPDPLLIGDMGPQYGHRNVTRGGSLTGHVSHRGRAADIYMYTLGAEHGAYAGRFDPERNTRLVTTFIRDMGARQIFVQRHIKDIIIRQARQNGESEQTIRLLQSRIRQPGKGHYTHFHVDF